MEIHQVADKIYRGVSPQTDEDFAYLKDQGIKRTLDLQTGSSFFGDGSPLEEQLNASRHEIQTFCHPLGVWLPPTTLELTLALQVMVSSARVWSAPIYVHCKAGVDRTGIVIAFYRIHFDLWSREKAIEEMRTMGMHPWYFYWVWSLR